MRNLVYQAIITRYHGPTAHRGSRITARCSARRFATEWDDSINSEKNHRRAAEALMLKLGWNETHTLVQGGMPGNHSGYCFVQVSRKFEQFSE